VPVSDGPVLPPPPPGGLVPTALAGAFSPDVLACLAEVGPYADLLGQRTGELHLALSEGDDPAFQPELVTALSQRSLYQSIRTSARRSFVLLRQRMRTLSDADQHLAREILEHEDAIIGCAKEVLAVRTGARARIHGDLHLGQVLFTGRDYVFVDFEGEPARSLSERRLKRSVLTDVAGILRSYHYAAHTAIKELETRGALEADDLDSGTAMRDRYMEAADRWTFWASAAFLGGYLEIAHGTDLIPDTDAEIAVSLEAQLFDKALYELRYELGNRPDWVHLPLLGVRSLIEAREGALS